jgi:hypothetical protein
MAIFVSLFILVFVVTPYLIALHTTTAVGLYTFVLLYTCVFLAAPLFVAYVIGKDIHGVRVIEHSWLMKILKIKGLAIYPVVFVEGKALTAKGNSTVILRHERIHLAQQAELFVLPFYIMYLVEETGRAAANKFFFRSAAGEKCYETAYYQISFEREAYDNENRSTYLKRRVPFAWCRYLFPRTT